jgi:phage terminase large subunit
MGGVIHVKRKLPYKPRDAFKSYHDRTQRFACNVVHRRGGKTVAGINDLIRDALRCPLPNPRVWYVAPTYGQAKRVAWDYCKQYTTPIEGRTANEAELRLDFPGGARLQLAGADNIDSLRGIYADSALLDECAFMAGSVWTKIIRPALSDRQGKATFISSVQGRNDFYDVYQEALRCPDEWFTMNLKASQSGLIDKAELAALRRQMSEEEYAQEYENDFDTAAKGSYYGALIAQAEQDGRVCGVPYDGAALVTTAWDIGIGDSTAIWFMQAVGRELHAIDYYEANGLPIAHYAAVLAQKGYSYGEHILPHDAFAKELGTGKAVADLLQAMGIRPKQAPNLKIDAGIQATRMILPRVWFDATKCERGLAALRQYRSAYDEKRKVLSNAPLHDFSSHCADAMRYFAVTYRDKQKSSEPDIPIRRRVGWVV